MVPDLRIARPGFQALSNPRDEALDPALDQIEHGFKIGFIAIIGVGDIASRQAH